MLMLAGERDVCRKQHLDIRRFISMSHTVPVPVAAHSKAFVYGRSPFEIVGSNPAGGMDVGVSGVFCEIEVL